MSEEKLKLCPFCGGKACYVDIQGMVLPEGETSPDVACVDPNCMPVSSYIPARNWNTRPIEDALREENKKLKDALKFYADGKHYEDDWFGGYTSIESDKGKIAQEALK